MRNLHVGVVDDVRKVVGRVAVGFDQNKVINNLRTGNEVSKHFVVPLIGLWIRLEA